MHRGKEERKWVGFEIESGGMRQGQEGKEKPLPWKEGGFGCKGSFTASNENKLRKHCKQTAKKYIYVLENSEKSAEIKQ